MQSRYYFFLGLGVVLLALISFAIKNASVHGAVVVLDANGNRVENGGDAIPALPINPGPPLLGDPGIFETNPIIFPMPLFTDEHGFPIEGPSHPGPEDAFPIPELDLFLPAPGIDDHGHWDLHNPVDEPNLFDGDIWQILGRLKNKCKDLVCKHFGPEEYNQLIDRISELEKEKRAILKDAKVEPKYTVVEEVHVPLDVLGCDDPEIICPPNYKIETKETTYIWPDDNINSTLYERDYLDEHIPALRIQMGNIIQNSIDLSTQINGLQMAIDEKTDELSKLDNRLLVEYYRDQIDSIQKGIDARQEQIDLLEQSVGKLSDEISRGVERINWLDSIINNIVPVDDKVKEKITAINKVINAINAIINNCHFNDSKSGMGTCQFGECPIKPA